jgi:ABC-2 type transport system permease protein
MTAADTSSRISGAATARRPAVLSRVNAMWQTRGILRILVVRDLKIRYSDSILGYVWTLLDPLLLTIVYWFVFGFIVSRGRPGESPFLLWLLTGVLTFQWTAHVMTDAGNLLGNDAKLVTASNLPRETWVLRTVLSRFVEFLFTLPITAVVALHYHAAPNIYWLMMLPVVFLVQGVFNTGLGLFLSPVCLLIPDMARVVRVFTTMYRYLSPVLFGVGYFVTAIKTHGNQFPSWLCFGYPYPRWIIVLFKINPMTGILDMYHRVFFPLQVQGLGLFFVATIGSFITLIVGWQTFIRLESRVLKEM